MENKIENTTVSLNIYQRIHAVMKEVSYVQKGEKKVDDKYKFVSHDRVAEIVHEQAVKHGFIIVPDVVESSVEAYKAVDKYNKDSGIKDIYIARVRINLRFINIDDPEDYFESKGWAGMGIDPQDKAVGKAISYAIKYGLLKVFVLETGDDPDNDQNIDYQKVSDNEKKLLEEQLQFKAKFESHLQNCSNAEEVLQLFKDSKTEMKEIPLNQVQFDEIIASCAKRKQEITAQAAA